MGAIALGLTASAVVLPSGTASGQEVADSSRSTPGQIAQHRTAPSRASATTYYIVNSYSGKCLTVDDSQNWDGGAVYAQECNTAVQSWYVGSNAGRWAVTATWDGRVLDAVLDNVNGSRITRYRWLEWDHQPRNQQWTHSTVTGEMRNSWNGRCLDADPGQANSYIQRVYLWDCNGSDWQKWLWY
ncbi:MULTISPECIES: RICIN domain-containing protein [unclassified Streptomyces]|uniref:RICIN domain-containing protein n=1 Tax=Streptomyces sp. NBC_00060 TaxID=2975636 RepID=A0AAU2H961_9ACTN